MTGILASLLPVVIVAGTTGAITVAALRSLRDETVLEALRVEARLFGETHQAVVEARSRTCVGRLGA